MVHQNLFKISVKRSLQLYDFYSTQQKLTEKTTLPTSLEGYQDFVAVLHRLHFFRHRGHRGHAASSW